MSTENKKAAFRVLVSNGAIPEPMVYPFISYTDALKTYIEKCERAAYVCSLATESVKYTITMKGGGKVLHRLIITSTSFKDK